MNRLLFAVLFTTFLVVGAVKADERPPNVVILLADDAGYADFSLHGKASFPTPRIDSIAANGVRFTDGYVSGCVCSPTRAGLLTGRYQQRFGHETNIPPVFSATNGLPLGERTFADWMRAGGYRTIALGKWHLGYSEPFHPLARGFDDYYGFLQGARSYFPLENPSRLNRLWRDREPTTENFTYMTDELGRQAAAQIALHRNKPFFMYVAFNAVHAPNQALEKDLAAARAAGADRPQIAAMTIALDRAIGTVLDGLQAHGLAEDTLVVFLNDNGGADGHDNGDLRGRKGSLWEGGIRVPFVMQWPRRLPKGKVVKAPVIAIDLLPTALAAADIPAEASPLDGVNLLPFLTSEVDQPPHAAIFWRSGQQWAVRAGDLKLVRVEDGPPLLFDLVTDRGETKNLADERPDDVARLREMYKTWEAGMREPIRWDGGAGGGRAKRRKSVAAVAQDVHAQAGSRHPPGGPFVFAHRGASGERPEHTLAAYALAIEKGADYVEPDLRRTKDGVLVCLHDATLERTTDVADRPEFASRARIDDKGRRRWHLADFTLTEVKTLSTRQGTAGRPNDFDGRDPVPTFAEAVALVRRHNSCGQRRAVGMAPEIKDGDADAFVTAVRAEGLEDDDGVPLHVQSFHLATLLAVRPRLASPCVWLLSRRPTDAEIADLAGQIDGFSIAKDALLGDDAQAFVARLHDCGYCVVAWTFADDRHNTKRFASPAAELAAALESGVDAFFTDFPASGVAARDGLAEALRIKLPRAEIPRGQD